MMTTEAAATTNTSTSMQEIWNSVIEQFDQFRLFVDDDDNDNKASDQQETSSHDGCGEGTDGVGLVAATMRLQQQYRNSCEDQSIDCGRSVMTASTTTTTRTSSSYSTASSYRNARDLDTALTQMMMQNIEEERGEEISISTVRLSQCPNEDADLPTSTVDATSQQETKKKGSIRRMVRQLSTSRLFQSNKNKKKGTKHIQKKRINTNSII